MTCHLGLITTNGSTMRMLYVADVAHLEARPFEFIHATYRGLMAGVQSHSWVAIKRLVVLTCSAREGLPRDPRTTYGVLPRDVLTRGLRRDVSAWVLRGAVDHGLAVAMGAELRGPAGARFACGGGDGGAVHDQTQLVVARAARRGDGPSPGEAQRVPPQCGAHPGHGGREWEGQDDVHVQQLSRPC